MSRHNRYDQRDTRDIKCKKGANCWYLFNSTCIYYHPKWQVQQARQYKRDKEERERRMNERSRRNRSRSRSEDRRRRNRRSRSSSRGYSRDSRSNRDSRGSSSWQSRDRQSRTPERRRSRSLQRRQTIIVQNPQIIPSRPNFFSPQDYDRHIASLSSPDHEFARQFEPKSKDGDDQFVDNLLENLRKSQPKQVQKPPKQHWSTQHLQAQYDSDQIKKEYPKAYKRCLQIFEQEYFYANIFNNHFVRLQQEVDQEQWISQFQVWMMGDDVGNEDDYMFFIENIRKYKLKDMTREQRQHHNCCTICQQSFVDSDADQNVEISHLYCNHAYHSNCILQYLNPPEKWNQAAQESIVNYHPKCPLCKKDFRDHDAYKNFDPNYKNRINVVEKDD